LRIRRRQRDALIRDKMRRRRLAGPSGHSPSGVRECRDLGPAADRRLAATHSERACRRR